MIAAELLAGDVVHLEYVLYCSKYLLLLHNVRYFTALLAGGVVHLEQERG